MKAGKVEFENEEVDLYEIVLNGAMTLRSLIGDKNIEIKYNFDPNLPKIIGDETRIQQVLYNIIGNAAKFTNEGSITISARQILKTKSNFFY